MKFSNNFIFGAAISAYQAEGGIDLDNKGKTVWDLFLNQSESNFNANISCDFYHLYEHDIKLAQQIGLKAIRVSISWARIFPKNNKDINELGVKFYHHLFKTCKKYNIKTYVTLFHFDTPLWVFNKGDFLNKSVIDDFFNYAAFCFEEFKNDVDNWITFNEIYQYNYLKYMIGKCYPCEIGNVINTIQANYNMVVAHAKVINYFKAKNYHQKIGIVHLVDGIYPDNNKKQEDIISAFNYQVFTFQAIFDWHFFGSLSYESQKVIDYLTNLYQKQLFFNKSEKAILLNARVKNDFVGINYYQSKWIKGSNQKTEINHNTLGNKNTFKFAVNGLGEIVSKKNIKSSDWDWNIYPNGLYDVMLLINKKYQNINEFIISENGFGYNDLINKDFKINDIYRINYLKDHLKVIYKLIYVHKLYIRGYFVWSLMDLFSWANSYKKRYGLLYVDFQNLKRYFKLSAFWYQELIRNKDLNIDLKKIMQAYELFDNKILK